MKHYTETYFSFIRKLIDLKKQMKEINKERNIYDI